MTTFQGVAFAATVAFASLLSVAAGAAEVSSAATSSCMAAVNGQYGGRVKNIRVVRSEFSQANSEVILDADGEHWRCLVSNGGQVEELTKQGGQRVASGGSISSAAESACMAAVNRNYGGKVKSLSVTNAVPHENKGNTVFIIHADGERWRCVASDEGTVRDLAIK